MEKIERMNDTDGFHLVLQKLFRITKLTALLMLVAVVRVLAVSSYSEATRISLDMENASVKDVLYQIEDNSEFYFVYSNRLIDVERKVNIKLTNKKITDVLDELFKGENVRYTINDRQIILSPGEMNLKSGDVIQQARKVTGNVKSEDGEALPGVSVVVKGTSIGTSY